VPERTLAPIFPSAAVEAEIRKAINDILAVARARADGRIYPAAKADRDALWDNIQQLRWEGRTVREMEVLRRQMHDLINRAEAPIKASYIAESARHGRKFEESIRRGTGAEDFVQQLNRDIGVDLRRVVSQSGIEPLIEAATSENVGLIRGLSDNVAARLETHLIRKITEGAANKEIAQTIVDDFGFGKSRAKLIARDQASKFNSSLNEIRQTKAGIEKYRWSTSRDERVRRTHRAKEGRVFLWSSPPSDTGHPGHEVRCRCTAAGIIEF
jgi:SPP1 gp7 family putative phage head morphogenesis protein